ncbi:hypothetical protein D8L93_07225 [Sodalis-like symbiont of Bactericera trigonica]|nr:hypothetical protein D8L93_07225 [Sodalis-like symbiont of Bactericera trigonica]
MTWLMLQPKQPGINRPKQAQHDVSYVAVLSRLKPLRRGTGLYATLRGDGLGTANETLFDETLTE